MSLVYFKDALVIFFVKAGGGFFCFSTRWRCVSNCSWPGPAAIWRALVQRFHLAQRGRGRGGEGARSSKTRGSWCDLARQGESGRTGNGHELTLQQSNVV